MTRIQEGLVVNSVNAGLGNDKQKRRAVLLASALLLALVLGIATFTLRAGGFPMKLAGMIPDLRSPASVSTALSTEVQRGIISKSLRFDGELRAVRSRTIFADTSEEAKITFLPPEGSVIRAGDRLVELDSTSMLTRIKEAEERIITAENEIVRTRSQHEGQLRDLEVELSRLWFEYEKSRVEARIPPEVVARREFQEKQFAQEKAKAEYDNHLAKIEQKKKEFAAEIQVKTIEKQKTQTELSKARANLNGMTIKAPTDGMVIYTDHWNERRKIQIGDVVWGGFPIVRLPDMAEMEVEARINEVDGPKISVGNKAVIRLDSYPDNEITGTVREISQTAAKAGWQSKARVFTVIITLDKTLVEIMKPGMSAQIALSTGDSGEQLLVPRSAIQFENGAPFVIRLETENNRRRVAVTIMAADPLQYAVAGNGALREKDRILLRP